MVTSNIEVPSFNSIHTHGSWNVRVVHSDSESVSVTTEGQNLEKLDVYVEGGILNISSKPGVSITGSVNFDVSAKMIKGVSSFGSGDIEIVGVSGEELILKLHGSGSISAIGEVGDLSLQIHGSGDVQCKSLRASSAQVEIMGSGNVSLLVEGNLDIEIAGSGDVTYSGNPKLQTKIQGSGNVTST